MKFTIAKEWAELKSELSDEELKDAEKAFHCGALAILSEFTEHLPPETVKELCAEIFNKVNP